MAAQSKVADQADPNDVVPDNKPDQASEALFAAQAEICRRRLDERRPQTARIIPLFTAAAAVPAARSAAGGPADAG